jgi:aminoglycoside phosphotransferase (APT) family kinase protein
MSGAAAPDLAPALERALARRFGETAISGLARLSGGATQETWSFDAKGGLDGGFILRRAPLRKLTQKSDLLSIETEAEVLEAVRKSGVLAPPVRFVLEPEDEMSSGFVMDRIPGEALAPRILRDPAFATARARMAGQCGAILAHLHATPADRVPALPTRTTKDTLDAFAAALEALPQARPVYQLALKWLRDRLPSDIAPRLIHGDFRLGNLLVGPEGVTAVLDWELASFGDPAMDLAWICVPSWRFGSIDLPVGGFGKEEDLLAAYEAAGGDRTVRERLHYFIVLGALRWGVMCTGSLTAMQTGADRSVERAMIARRCSETELDLMRLLDPDWRPHAG